MIRTHSTQNILSKEVKTMTYTKPELLLAGSAASAIQSHLVKLGLALEFATSGPNQGQFNATPIAYEADE
jgi:hypothetical protein